VNDFLELLGFFGFLFVGVVVVVVLLDGADGGGD
jgi:hypothetical protein